jgi:hypothetical protein
MGPVRLAAAGVDFGVDEARTDGVELTPSGPSSLARPNVSVSIAPFDAAQSI